MPRLTRRQALAASAALPAAAALPGAASAQGEGAGATRGALHRAHRLGETEVVTLLDATLPSDALGGAPHETFGLNVDDATFEEVSRNAFIPADTAQFFFTPVLVRAGGNVILFDTGLGQGGLRAALEDAGASPSDVTHVVITHMHPDHVGGLVTDGAPTFEGAEHVTGEAEMAFWSENPSEAVTANVLPLKDRFTLISDGAEIAPGITAVAAFGHTPGHMTFRVDDGDRSMLVFADTANHYVWSLAPSRLGGAVRHGQGAGRRNAQARARHAGLRAHGDDGLPHALPGLGLRGGGLGPGRRRLPLGSHELPVHVRARPGGLPSGRPGADA